MTGYQLTPRALVHRLHEHEAAIREARRLIRDGAADIPTMIAVARLRAAQRDAETIRAILRQGRVAA